MRQNRYLHRATENTTHRSDGWLCVRHHCQSWYFHPRVAPLTFLPVLGTNILLENPYQQSLLLMDIEGAIHPSCRWLCHKCYLACRSPTSCDPVWGPSDRPVPSPMVIKYPSPYSLLKRDQPFLLRMRLFPTFLLILKSKTLGNGIKDPAQNLSECCTADICLLLGVSG